MNELRAWHGSKSIPIWAYTNVISFRQRSSVSGVQVMILAGPISILAMRLYDSDLPKEDDFGDFRLKASGVQSAYSTTLSIHEERALGYVGRLMESLKRLRSALSVTSTELGTMKVGEDTLRDKTISGTHWRMERSSPRNKQRLADRLYATEVSRQETLAVSPI